MMENKNDRPLVIMLDDAKTELTQCINHLLNDYNLPCYLIEPILADMYTQVKAGANKELAAARAQINNTGEGME